jgi:hypothetical protein
VQTEVLMEVHESICRLCAKYVDSAKTPASIMLLLPSRHVPAAASAEDKNCCDCRTRKTSVDGSLERVSARTRKEEHSRPTIYKRVIRITHITFRNARLREDFIQL